MVKNRRKINKKSSKKISNDDLIEVTLWKAANKLRSNMHASEYKNVVLGLVFLKYLSDVFFQTQKEIEKNKDSDIEDRDEYIAKNVFYVPKEARWNMLQSFAKNPKIGVIVDNALDNIEKENESLRGVLQKNYARPELDKHILGELIDLFSSVNMSIKNEKSNDVLGKVYEYFLGKFGEAEGNRAGEFYTPKSIVDLLVAMLEPYKGRVFDPCCGSGGMFVQSEKFVRARGGNIKGITIRGQESTHATWRLCKMNMVMHKLIDADIRYGNSFTNDKHKDLKADYILANPPFNQKNYGSDLLKNDVRWKYGIPPKNNANFAWVQHFIHHLSPTGRAGFVLSNGSLSSTTSNEDNIRKKIIMADLVDCIVALPSALFYNTPIPACLWFLNRRKTFTTKNSVLFIDARKFGLLYRRHRTFEDDDIKKIATTYHNWRQPKKNKYMDIAGFCKSVHLNEIIKNDSNLVPGRYVGVSQTEHDPESFYTYMITFTKEYKKILKESRKLDKEIQQNLGGLGFEI